MSIPSKSVNVKTQPAPTNSSENDGSKSHRCKPTQKGLNMTKLGKADLIRLLSILEGELEARDIYITNLQAQINRDSHARERYFHHGITDPFVALMRDNEAFSGSVTPSQEKSKQKSFGKEVVRIEPLPLLEKVVNQCKVQQIKVKRHLSLSDAYYNLVNEELMVVKRRHAVDTATGDDVTAALEKEREKLQILVRVEKEKTKQMESDYKNLLQTVNKERQRFRTIVTMLLEERSGSNNSPEVDGDDELTENKLKVKYHEVIDKNQDLESKVQKLKVDEMAMRDEIEKLQQELRNATLDEASLCTSDQKHHPMVVAESCKDVTLVRTGCEPPLLINNADEVKIAGYYSVVPPSGHTEESSTTISVKRTSSVIEKRNVKSGEKPFMSQFKPASKSGNSADTQDAENLPKYSSSLHPPPPERMSFQSSELSLKLSSSIVSSPTSGAANFALNSPNEPPSNSPFHAPALPVKAQKPTSAPGSSFQATRQKFQRFSKTKPSPPSTSSGVENQARNTHNISNRPSNNSIDVTDSHAVLPCVPKSSKTENKAMTRKASEQSIGYKPQPPKPIKNGLSKAPGNDDVTTTQTRPPPLPPKKPNLISKQNSMKATNRKDHEASKKISGTAVGDRTSRLSSPKPAVNSHAKPTNHQQSSKLGMKRPTSLNTNSNNNNNNNNNRSSKRLSNSGSDIGNIKVHPMPPGSAPARLSLSAQQRLFPPQDGSGGQLRSPITNTVPKSPLGTSMFTFK